MSDHESIALLFRKIAELPNRGRDAARLMCSEPFAGKYDVHYAVRGLAEEIVDTVGLEVAAVFASLIPEAVRHASDTIEARAACRHYNAQPRDDVD